MVSQHGSLLGGQQGVVGTAADCRWVHQASLERWLWSYASSVTPHLFISDKQGIFIF